jgi:hypothetical protein
MLIRVRPRCTLLPSFVQVEMMELTEAQVVSSEETSAPVQPKDTYDTDQPEDTYHPAEARSGEEVI